MWNTKKETLVNLQKLIPVNFIFLRLHFVFLFLQKTKCSARGSLLSRQESVVSKPISFFTLLYKMSQGKIQMHKFILMKVH